MKLKDYYKTLIKNEKISQPPLQIKKQEADKQDKISAENKKDIC